MIRGRPPIAWQGRPLRSLLFAPASEPRKVERLRTVRCDAVVFDLEDAVAESAKASARALVSSALGEPVAAGAVMSRVNGWATGQLEADLSAVVCPELDAVVLPKLESPAELAELDVLLLELEAERGVPRGSIRIVGLIETARGLARVEDIAFDAPGRLLTFAFGLADFAADVGLEPSGDGDGDEFLYARSRIVVAARAAGRSRPLDGPYLDVDDLPGLAAASRRSRRLGFGGRVVIHPLQVEVVDTAYSALSAEERAAHEAVVTGFERAHGAGAASVRVGGRFVDYPVYRHALASLQRAETGTEER